MSGGFRLSPVNMAAARFVLIYLFFPDPARSADHGYGIFRRPGFAQIGVAVV